MASSVASAAIDYPGYRPLPIRRPDVSVTVLGDAIYLEQAYDIPDLWPSMSRLFEVRARRYPDRAFVAKRVALRDGGFGDWRKITYREALAASRSIAQALIDRRLRPGDHILIVSGPSIEHAVLMMGAMAAQVAIAPASTNYSLALADFTRLHHVFEVCRPRLIFADDGPAYEAALRSLPLDGIEVVTATPPRELPATSFAALLSTSVTEAVDVSIAAITHDTVAKTIFTSGSTGAPKGVIQTHRMLCGVVAQHAALYIPDEEPDEGDASLSWLPWSHVGGSNIRFAQVINDAATYYIDEGRPQPGYFEETLRNLREIRPKTFSSTPAFFAHLAAAMERDAALRERFFSKLRYLSYSTAGMSQDIFDRLQSLSMISCGKKIPIITQYGATEIQGATIVTWPLEQTGPIGLPFPGMVVKLAPVGDKLEIRCKGLTVTPGYLNNPEATARSFDEEGFYRTGDAACFLDPGRPEMGLVFDGRVVENFKLSSGTWVSVGTLRIALVEALAPVIQDCVIAGENRDFVVALAWLRPKETAALTGRGASTPLEELARDDRLRAHLSEALARFNARAGGSSRRVERLLVTTIPPSGDEITEKGYINQRASLRRRADEVATLYAATPGQEVIVPR